MISTGVEIEIKNLSVRLTILQPCGSAGAPSWIISLSEPFMAEKSNLFEYTEESIKSLDWREHIRLRPGMYIGKLGDGSSPDDGIYVLLKEVIDNCIDEHTMGYGKQVDINIDQKTVTIRDFGRGIPLGKVVDVVKKI